ncbi:YcbK family protein [Vibrio taketomensis]|uniref:YcbK family protein n=1 Tax=Vibrio taketomensis TaxID=2572923 RepID=UPI001389F1B5|nr:YcbK family protein [Vibrio taketomensis]
MQVTRRNFIKLAGSGLVVASCAPSVALASTPDLSRSLAFNNLHTGENLETCYFDGKQYVAKELGRINHICRDFRRNEIHKMDKHLFDQISLIQKELGVDSEVQIISGYRSPATNASLRAHSSGVAKKSYHMTGQAIDFRLEGVSLRRVRDVAREIKAGGVGYYPSSNFVHIDTGPVRYWS